MIRLENRLFDKKRLFDSDWYGGSSCLSLFIAENNQLFISLKFIMTT